MVVPWLSIYIHCHFHPVSKLGKFYEGCIPYIILVNVNRSWQGVHMTITLHFNLYEEKETKVCIEWWDCYQTPLQIAVHYVCVLSYVMSLSKDSKTDFTVIMSINMYRRITFFLHKSYLGRSSCQNASYHDDITAKC